jgi:signal transduction histidine kinase
MKDSFAIRDAERVLKWSLAIRIGGGLLMGALAALLFPWVREALTSEMRGGRFLVTLPLLILALLTFTPWLKRLLGRRALAVLLTLDVLNMSLQGIPVFFFRGLAAGNDSIWHRFPADPIIELQMVEPFLFLLVPLVLLAWAYGRRGAVWGSTLAALLHLATGVWAVKLDVLTFYHLPREMTRIALIYIVPLLVSFLARRERRQIRDLEVAHRRLQRTAAATEQLATSRERNRLARDLHDTLAHTLAALKVHLEALRTLQTHDPEAAQEAADRAVHMAHEGLEESRQAIQALRSDPLGSVGLPGAVRSMLADFQSRTGIEVELVVSGQDSDLTDEETGPLYRIVEEAVSNVQLHADAGKVTVRLSLGVDRIDVSVSDDGAGFDPAAIDADDYGLLGMRERAEMIGATLETDSRPGGGTEIRVSLER